jgi:uncharacterized membrane protein YeaQ/YmgE (transglycosylase-associated protein family)
MLYAIIIGFFIGLVAKFLMPGRDPGGFIITVLIGIAGSAIANWIGATMGVYQQGETGGFIAAVLGSMILLAVYRMFAGKRVS